MTALKRRYSTSACPNREEGYKGFLSYATGIALAGLLTGGLALLLGQPLAAARCTA